MENILIYSTEEIREIVSRCVGEAIQPLINGGSQRRDDGNPWLTNREALAYLGLSKPTLQRYRTKGILPFVKLGNNVYYRRSDIDDLLEKNLRMPTSTDVGE